MKALVFVLSLLLSAPCLAALRGTTVSQTTTSVTSTSITYSGTAIQTGDLIILVSMCNAGGDPSPITDPSGFTAGGSLTSALPDVLIDSAVLLHVAVKIAGSGDTGTPTYTTTSMYGCYWVQQMRVYSGRVNSSVNAAFPNNVATAAGTVGASPYTYTLTGLTASAGDDVVAFVGSAVPDGATNGDVYALSISGFSNNVGATLTNVNQDPPLGADHLNVSAGATGSLSASLTVTHTTNLIPAGFVMALHQASGGSCTDQGITSAGAIATPNGSSGSYQGKTGSFVTPDCSSVNYKSAAGNFVTN